MDVMSTECSVSRVTVWFQLARFAVVVLLLSSVFYLVGPVLGSLRWLTNSNLPVAALMAVCPGIAALVLSRREKTFPRLMGHLAISGVRWQVWAFAVLALPVIVFGASAVTGYAGFSVPSAASAALIGAVYLIGATAEEIGWTGYALPRLLRVNGEFVSGLILGAFWAAWHVIPYAEAGNDLSWIAGQCFFTIALRLLLVRISVASRLSVWPAVVGHAGYNLAWSLSPSGGAHYEPWVVGLLTTAVAAVLYLGLWLSSIRSTRSFH